MNLSPVVQRKRARAKRRAAIIAASKKRPVLSLAEIGEQFGITRERVRQVLDAEGIRRERAQPRCRGIVKQQAEARRARKQARRAKKAMTFARILTMRAGGMIWRDIGTALGFTNAPAVQAMRAAKLTNPAAKSAREALAMSLRDIMP